MTRPDIARPTGIIAEGVSRRRNVSREFYRVRHSGDRWHVEQLIERQGRPVWWTLAHYDTQEAAMETFAGYARTVPAETVPGGIPSIGP